MLTFIKAHCQSVSPWMKCKCDQKLLRSFHVVRTFESVSEILKCDHSNESY